MKNLLTQWEIEEDNQRTGDNVLLIDRKHNSNMLLIDRKIVELQDDAECASLPKLTELMKKPTNLTRTRQEKPHRPLFHSLAYFVWLVRQPRFCFAEGLAGLTDGFAMGGAELREREIAIVFSG